jgi:putative DNA primase/helicase
MPEGTDNAAQQNGLNVPPSGDEGTNEKKKDKRSMECKIVEYIQPQVELFHTPEQEAYVRYRRGQHSEIHRVKSKEFRMMLTTLARREFHTPPTRSAVDAAVDSLEAAAITQGPEQKVHYRYARVDDALYIDLGNKKWDAVRVTAAGWEVVSDAPVRFVRHKNIAELPYPSKTPDLRKLRKLMNVACEEDWVLIAVWLIAAMSGIGPYAILLILGPQGSSKSALAALLRRIIDPVVKAPLRSLWRNDWDLAIAASRSAVLAFDNISKITAEQSDAACRLATSSGFGTRQLWTPDEETIFDGMRPLIFNGISEFATRPDLLERSLIIVLAVIRPDQRRSLTDVNREFEQHWPDIFAGLLDALSAVLKNMPTAEATARELPRMADFALVGIAAEPACPWEPGDFLKAYSANQHQGHAIAVESDPFAQMMLAFGGGLRFQDSRQWVGTATDLREQLLNPETNVRDLPATPAALSSELRRLQPVLAAGGIHITFDRKGAGGNRMITITWKEVAKEEAAGD